MHEYYNLTKFHWNQITVWGLVGIWGCRFRSKCSVGTAGRKKISKCWLQETNNFLEIICHFDLTYNITEIWQLIYLVSLVLRSLPCTHVPIDHRVLDCKPCRRRTGERTNTLFGSWKATTKFAFTEKKLNSYFALGSKLWCGGSLNHMEF